VNGGALVAAGNPPVVFGGRLTDIEDVLGEPFWAAEIFGITGGGPVSVYFVEEFLGP